MSDMEKPLFAVHAGEVMSKSGDEDLHFVSVGELVRLYKLARGAWFPWNEKTKLGKNPEDYYHLFPDYHGKYELPKKKGF